MFSVLQIVGLSVLAVVIVLVIYVTTRPNQFRIVRQVSIKAPLERVYPRINDLRRFNEWNPFAKADPSTKIVYAPTDTGQGGRYDWDSVGRAGKGSMVITATTPNRIAMDLHFEKPMQADNKVVFSLQSQGPNTDVTREMSGRYGLLHKIMGIVFNLDKMVGGEFAKGLADLKSQAETA